MAEKPRGGGQSCENHNALSRMPVRRCVGVMASAPPIPGVCAVIERDGLVLLAQRPTDKHLPLKWEFAGGKVEPGEDAPTAILREIREELGCEIVITRALPRFEYDYTRVVIEMIPFVCALAPGSAEPHAHEHVALAWVRPGELATYDLAPADLPVVADYLKR
jgi:8-oxo-dGTP diphosphatase